MAEKYLLFNLEDEQAKKLGEVIANQTAREIANLIAEKEVSESEISRQLGLPLNTVGYNINKLVEAGIIEKSKNYFWSQKGKRIEVYRIANKLIVISPKKSNIYSKLKGIVPVVLISGILALIVAWQSQTKIFVQKGVEKAAEIPVAAISAEKVSEAGVAGVQASTGLPVWVWFAIGALVAIIVFLAWNWKKL